MRDEMRPLSLFRIEFLKPRYWLIWLGIGVMGLVCLCPLPVRWKLGRTLGALFYRFGTKRRHIATKNIEACFPELNTDEVTDLVKRHFYSVGMGAIETLHTWLGSAKTPNGITDIEGLEILHDAAQQGRGVLLLGMHLTTLDVCAGELSFYQPFDSMYRKNKNRLLETIMSRGRLKYCDSVIERSDLKKFMKRLRQGAVIWYGPDQDYGRQHSVFAPFFGISAATITATARIVQATKAEVVTLSHFRDEKSGRYLIKLSKLPKNYPTDDAIKNCTIVNQSIEKAVLEDPAQYWWLHRRFKTRPKGEKSLYL